MVTNLFRAQRQGGGENGGEGGEGEQQQRRGQQRPPQASFDEQTNTLVVVGSADQLAMVEQLIEKIDGTSGGRGASPSPQTPRG
jgi:type II secretory pathway component GspD/PulD (secretin)